MQQKHKVSKCEWKERGEEKTGQKGQKWQKAVKLWAVWSEVMWCLWREDGWGDIQQTELCQRKRQKRKETSDESCQAMKKTTEMSDWTMKTAQNQPKCASSAFRIGQKESLCKLSCEMSKAAEMDRDESRKEKESQWKGRGGEKSEAPRSSRGSADETECWQSLGGKRK